MSTLRRAGVALAALTVTALGLSGCGSSSSAEPGGAIPVVASTNVYGDIAKQIGGDRVSVTSIIADPSQDPHSYEASARTKLALSKADVVIKNGGGYDDFVGTLLDGGDSDATVIDAVTVSGRKAPAGGELNEHVWYDFPSMRKLADRIATALSAKDEGAAKTFRANADRFEASLAELEATEASIAKAHRGEGVAITEPVPLYMLTACGLVNRTPAAFSEAVEEGDDVPVSVLNATLNLFRDKKVKLLAYNEQTSGPVTSRVEAAAKASGVAVVPVTETLPAGKDYLQWMRANLTAIGTALD
ncbi:TroA family protein [Jatrophihabitans fulvus]